MRRRAPSGSTPGTSSSVPAYCVEISPGRARAASFNPGGARAAAPEGRASRGGPRRRWWRSLRRIRPRCAPAPGSLRAPARPRLSTMRAALQATETAADGLGAGDSSGSRNRDAMHQDTSTVRKRTRQRLGDHPPAPDQDFRNNSSASMTTAGDDHCATAYAPVPVRSTRIEPDWAAAMPGSYKAAGTVARPPPQAFQSPGPPATLATTTTGTAPSLQTLDELRQAPRHCPASRTTYGRYGDRRSGADHRQRATESAIPHAPSREAIYGRSRRL